ncbi:MAG: ATP-binding protein [Saprospiraceae bacterium]|nr:ATP-binding protein [Candidatus Vicinibacter affinis]
MKFLVRISKLRYESTLEQIICSTQRNLTETISKLSDCSFIKKSENILISGATGAGKELSGLCQGHQACSMGYKVSYFNMNRFYERISISKLDGTFNKLLNNLQDKLIIWMILAGTFDNNLRLALLQHWKIAMVRSSTIIASQLPIKKLV